MYHQKYDLMTEYVKWLWIIVGSSFYFGWYAILILLVAAIVMLLRNMKNF